MSLPSKDKKLGPVAKTIRLELNLFEPTRDSYPEFNFLELTRIQDEKEKEIRRKKELQIANGMPPDIIDNDDDVIRIAKHFEKKYSGAAYGAVRLARGVKRDEFADIAAGYDENDSFIDNTDAYDEMIPRDLETKRGGFYINCGPLEYEKLPNCEGDTPSRVQKRQHSTSTTSSDESTAQKEKKFQAKKVCLPNNNSGDNMVKNVKSSNGISKSSASKDKLNYNPTTNNIQKTDDKLKSSNGRESEKSKKVGKMESDKKSSGSESHKSGQNSLNKLPEISLSSNLSNTTEIKKSSNTLIPSNKGIGSYPNIINTAKQIVNTKQIEHYDEAALKKSLTIQELLQQKNSFLDLSVELINPDRPIRPDTAIRTEGFSKPNNHIL